MGNIKLSTLFLGAFLFLSIGAGVANAEAMKCGAGKCGSSMKAPKACDDKKCTKDKDGKCSCGPECNCEHKKDSKKASNKAMKCGAGKCGSSMKAPVNN